MNGASDTTCGEEGAGPRLRIVCSTSVAEAVAIFSRLGEVTCLPEESLTRELLAQADVLVTRSKRVIDAGLLDGTPVQFYGTATAGTDHVDTVWLEDRGIAWTAAPGCNAASVVDYVLAGLLRLATFRKQSWAGSVLGIVGVGHIGSRLAERACALGVRVMLNDPPRQEAGDPGPFVAIDELLAEADILSLHVPLTDVGIHATRGMVNRDWLSRWRKGGVWVNACRGEVVDEAAWREAVRTGHITNSLVDVYNREPDVDPAMVRSATLATPHIAGYSLEGRVRGTIQVYEAVCRHFHRRPDPASTWLPGPVELAFDASVPPSRESVLWHLVSQVYDPFTDALGTQDTELSPSGVRDAFLARRKNYPSRRELGSARISASALPAPLIEVVRDFGFCVSAEEGS